MTVDQILQRVVQKLHPVPRAGLDGADDLEGLALQDHAANGGGDDHDLEYRRAAAADLRQEGLAHGTLQHVRQLDADLVLLLGGERVDDTVDGLRRADGVQCAHDQVAGLGGGDGGVARELGYYDEIEQIDVVEPDRVFVEVCKEFFPDNACGLSDERVTVYYEDGLKFLRMKHDEYDLIINDAIDPLGHTAGLFTKEFYGNCFRALKDDGIMVYQHGSPFYDEDEESCRGMPISRVYQAHIPTCSSGYWLFGFASKKYHPLDDLDAKRWKERKIKTWYYTTNLHKGAFMLPRYVEDMLEEEEGRKK